MYIFGIKNVAALVVVTLCAALLPGNGCSSIKIHHDFDKDADFGSYATYDWLENRPGYAGRSGATTRVGAPVDKIVRAAIITELDRTGYRQDADNPDVVVVYHVGMADQIDVTVWGYQYAPAYWGWHGRGADVYTYREGTLIVDLIDAATMTLAWRGAAQSAIDEHFTSDMAEKTILEAVGKMFKGYPPAQ